MKFLTTICQKTALRRKLQELRAKTPGRYGSGLVGLVPTMGYLHEGHASLLRAARTQCDVVVLSIFVNPLQFGPSEDYSSYPRDVNRDMNYAGDCGVDVIFAPPLSEMYPSSGSLTTVSVANLTAIMCGSTRPTHFNGVTTVVAKLFNIVKPDYAYFGMKDAQQVAVVEQMVSDLDMDVGVVRCPTVREPDGLAMSSRNVHLNAEERRQAAALNQALDLAEETATTPGVTFAQLVAMVAAKIGTMPLAVLKYVEVAYYPSLRPVDLNVEVVQAAGTFIVALSVAFGKANLIDNRIIIPKENAAF